jgi:exocyst complex component 1
MSQANIYAFLEDDDRVGLVLKYIDDAILELDSMDTLVSSYKIHLNVSAFEYASTPYFPDLRWCTGR